MSSPPRESEPSSSGGERSAGYRAVFAVAEFRAVFAAHAMSTLGVVVAEISLSVLVYRITGSPLMSALTFAFGLLPYALGGTLLSSVADRFPARRVLVVCDLVCAVCAAAMAVPDMPVALLLVLRCVTAAVAPIFQGTRASTLGDILGEGDLFVLGRSVVRIVGQTGQLAGFGAGGLLLTVASPRAVLVWAVATFLGSAVLLRFGTRRRPARAATGGALIGSSLAGMRLLLGDRRIRSLLLLCWVPPTFVVVPEALLTPYASALGLAPAGLGLLMCGMPIGAILSETLAGSLLGPRGRARLTRPVAVLAMLPAIGYAFEPSLGWALACQVLTGCGIAYTLGLDQWFVAAVPEELRGRAMTLMTAGLMTAQGLGMAVAGGIAEFVPVHQVIAGGGVLGTVCVAAVLRSARDRPFSARAPRRGA
ncbi:MFS transporter [Nonomuraea phyllanthi]|uniref:MFS transporter n=1 Tax=Nonomuraea phyllanthi TaxID=2219224 RepID=A0A5C4W4U5_9ACTN|nr:MFS transporter [Nonomuraea phyllanthi]KAB8191899.1 MFS transporter [Nonomuraea phyllanthi]